MYPCYGSKTLLCHRQSLYIKDLFVHNKLVVKLSVYNITHAHPVDQNMNFLISLIQFGGLSPDTGLDER